MEQGPLFRWDRDAYFFENRRLKAEDELEPYPWIVDGQIYHSLWTDQPFPIQDRDYLWLPFVHQLLNIPCSLEEFLSVCQPQGPTLERPLIPNTVIKDNVCIRTGSRRVYVYCNGLLVKTFLNKTKPMP